MYTCHIMLLLPLGARPDGREVRVAAKVCVNNYNYSVVLVYFAGCPI